MLIDTQLITRTRHGKESANVLVVLRLEISYKNEGPETVPHAPRSVLNYTILDKRIPQTVINMTYINVYYLIKFIEQLHIYRLKRI